jgi:hypothetical protein
MNLNYVPFNFSWVLMKLRERKLRCRSIHEGSLVGLEEGVGVFFPSF